jgi:uncharacterized protein (DUF1330 family)
MQFMVWRFGLMSGYWIVRCRYNNQEAFLEYASKATDVVKKHDGEFLVRGGEQLQMEDGDYERTVMVRFPSLDIAKQAYESEEYKTALKIIESNADRDFIITEGL